MTLRHSVVRQYMIRILRAGPKSAREFPPLMPLCNIRQAVQAEFCLRELRALCALGYIRIDTVDPEDNLNTTYALR